MVGDSMGVKDLLIMSVREIETAITRLSATDLAELMTWLAEYHGKAWDPQIEEDLDAGRLDAMLADVEQEYQSGLASPL